MVKKQKNNRANIFIVSILAFVIFLSWHFHLAAEKRFLEKELSRFLVPPVASEYGKVFAIEGGKVITGEKSGLAPYKQQRVLRSAYYSVLTRISPVLGFPGVDVDAFSAAIAEIDHNANVFAMPYSDKSRGYLQNTFPRELFEKFVELETLRRKIVDSPSPDAIRRYHAYATNDVVPAYKKFLTDYKNSYDGLSEGDKYKLHFRDGSVTQKNVRLFLEEIDKALSAVVYELEKRFDCFNGLNSRCPVLAFLPIPVPNGDFPQREMSGKEIGVLAEKKELVLAHYGAYGNLSENTEGIPTVFLNKSACTQNAAQYAMVFREWPPEAKRSVRPVLLSEFYFNDLTTQGSIQSLFTERMQEHEARYMLQPISNVYYCAGSSFDYHRALSVLTVYDFLQNHPIFMELGFSVGQTSGHKTLGALEEKIIDGEYLYENDVYEYMLNLQILLGQGENRLLKKLDEKTIVDVERLLVSYSAQTAGFEKLLFSMAQQTKGLANLHASGLYVIKPIQTFVRYSAPQLIFLTGNRTVLKQPVYIAENTGAFNPRGHDLISVEELRERMSFEDILRETARSKVIYESLFLDFQE